MQNYIYHFAQGNSLNSVPPHLVGNKGNSLLVLAQLNLPVPAGFIISAEVCRYYYQYKTLPPDFASKVLTAVQKLENITGKVFGKTDNPLLLAVRSGAAVSMPGMMDTVLNVGINENIALRNTAPHRPFPQHKLWLDNYQRLLKQWAHLRGVKYEGTLPREQVKAASNFPEDPYEQLHQAILMVLDSWVSERAIIYRGLHQIDDNLGTAIIIQSMVFGNYNEHSATGVVFSRDPVNGIDTLYGEFLPKAQGEDIVSGSYTPLKIDGLAQWNPKNWQKLSDICKYLEKHFARVQDIEFTIEDQRLYILQTRNAKQTMQAELKTLVDLAHEQIITKEQALSTIKLSEIGQVFHNTLIRTADLTPIARGLPASPGSARGRVVFSPLDAMHMKTEPVVLLRYETSPEDIGGLQAAAGLVTARGGVTSHAAVVARGMGKPCICGINELVIDEANQQAYFGERKIARGDYLTIDGTSGEIFLGQLELQAGDNDQAISTISSWAREYNQLKVRANAETLTDIALALKLGAEGIGLCRTEHMLFSEPQLTNIRTIIISTNEAVKKQALRNLEQQYIQDFKAIFAITQGKPINIRLLDPPLHEFLPHGNENNHLLRKNGITEEELQRRLVSLQETNPMMGLRGCRLGLVDPTIYHAQIRAIFTAAILSEQATNLKPKLEIMIPFIATRTELAILVSSIRQIATQLQKGYLRDISYKIGTMIELPRAAIIASELADLVDYFSFGTNDLTQMVFGISRDDIGSFLPSYLSQGILPCDPFTTLDQQGVGWFIKHAIKTSKAVNSNLSYAICGEQAADPISIDFINTLGIDYISCSPYRVFTASLAIAQNKIKQQ